MKLALLEFKDLQRQTIHLREGDNRRAHGDPMGRENEDRFDAIASRMHQLGCYLIDLGGNSLADLEGIAEVLLEYAEPEGDNVLQDGAIALSKAVLELIRRERAGPVERQRNRSKDRKLESLSQ